MSSDAGLFLGALKICRKGSRCFAFTEREMYSANIYLLGLDVFFSERGCLILPHQSLSWGFKWRKCFLLIRFLSNCWEVPVIALLTVYSWIKRLLCLMFVMPRNKSETCLIYCTNNKRFGLCSVYGYTEMVVQDNTAAHNITIQCFICIKC